jgi:hypothetical protein
MNGVDWTALLIGAGAGIGMSAVYFAGLAIGMQRALRTDRPMRLLALSGAVRIAALLAAGWFVAAQLGPWALAGYAIAFSVVRFIATSIARAGISAGAAE